MLSLFRINKPQPQADELDLGKSSDHEGSESKKVVLLWHGLLDSAYTYLYDGNRSLALTLCDAGYDVWLGNNRGNLYSTKHTFLDPADADFWKFTFDEFAIYDLPDSIEYVLQTSGASRLGYIGHSEGTTQMFAMLSRTPSTGDQISAFVGLGPAVSLGHVGGAMGMLARWKVDRLVWGLGIRKRFMSGMTGWIRSLAGSVCSAFPWLVDDIVRMLCGQPAVDMDPTLMCDWAYHEPAGTSVLNMSHWAQAVRYNQTPLSPNAPPPTGLRMFDFGAAENLLRYGSADPPRYAIENIPLNVPMQLWSGGRDTLADPQDVAWLVQTLRSNGVSVDHHPLDDYNHTDFVWSPDAASDIHPSVLSFLAGGTGVATAQELLEVVAAARQSTDDEWSEGDS